MDFQKLLSQSKKKPQHILKLVLSFSVVILVIWLFMVSRMDLSTTNTSQDPAVQARTEGLKTSLLQKEQESAQKEGETQPETIAQPKQAVTENEAPNVFQNAFVTFALMITVMGGAWFWVKKKGSSSRKKTEDERDRGAYDLGPGAQLKFVEINQEVWVLSLTGGSVNLLHRIPNAEWNENEMDVPLDTKTASTADFKSFYKYFRN
jgi:flagellar biogenesis protein FliO